MAQRAFVRDYRLAVGGASGVKLDVTFLIVADDGSFGIGNASADVDLSALASDNALHNAVVQAVADAAVALDPAFAATATSDVIVADIGRGILAV